MEHEHLEAITDPRGNAWQDSTGGAGENGDKCNRIMGVANASSTTVNNFLGSGFGDFFRIQREWSNAAALATSAGNGCAASYTTTGSSVEAPNPTGGDVTASVTEGTIQGNSGDALHYHVSFHNPSNQDDAYSVSDAISYPGSVSGPASTSLGDLAPHQTANGNPTATVTAPLLDGTVLTTTFTSNFDDSTTTAQPGIVRTATTTVVNAPPTLNLPGAQSQDYHDSLTFGVSASDTDSGDTVALGASGLPSGLALTDNGDGTGTVSGTITAAPGVYTATFTADDHHHLTLTSDTVQITVTQEETTTAYTGPTVVAQGFPVTLTAQLLEDGTAAPAPSGQTVTLTIGAQSCPATTDALGNAQCTVGSVNAPLGTSIPITATFAGDTYYLSSSAASTAIVFAFPPVGDFVLGDQSVAAAGPTTTLTWWSSDWSVRERAQRGCGAHFDEGVRQHLDAVGASCLRRNVEDDIGQQPAAGRDRIHPELHGRARLAARDQDRSHALERRAEDRGDQDQRRLLPESRPQRDRDIRRDLLRLAGVDPWGRAPRALSPEPVAERRFSRPSHFGSYYGQPQSDHQLWRL